VRGSTTAGGGEWEAVELLRAVTEGRTAAGARRLEATGVASPGLACDGVGAALARVEGPCEGWSEVRVQHSHSLLGAIGFPNRSACVGGAVRMRSRRCEVPGAWAVEGAR
jgi:hypothetical protein